MTDQHEEHECAPISPLVATLVERMAQDTAHTTNALIGGLEYQEAHLRATLEIVRETILGLLDGPYMPMPQLIKKACYPPEKMIKLRMYANGYKKERSRG